MTLVLAGFAARASCRAAETQAAGADVVALVEQKHYLEVEALLRSGARFDAVDDAFLKGVIANRRNRVAESIRLLEPLVKLPALAHTRRGRIALSALADDYEKSFRYGDASDAYAELVRRFGDDMSPANRAKYIQEAGHWSLLRGAPRQTAVIPAPFTIPSRRDAMGLLEAEVRIGHLSQWMILDTGANISTVSRSVARRLGLPLSSAHTETTGMSGKPMPVHTAVIPELRLGPAIFRNVAVMVIEDDDMMVAPTHYKLDGSLGFPVLSALQSITFLAGRVRVAVPKTRRGQHSNLFLEKLTPVVAATVGGVERLFTIDTGATGSFLSQEFYREHRAELASRPSGSLLLMGAGGEVTIPAFFLSEFPLSIGHARIELQDLPVLTKSPDPSAPQFFGNLGQSALRRLHSYTFDFKNMIFAAD